jgi:hypothetical protein
VNVFSGNGEKRSSSASLGGGFVSGCWDDSNMCFPEETARAAALAELTRLDPAALDPAGLMAAVTEVSVFISQAQGQLARLAGALDAGGGSAEAGCASTAAFLRGHCGVTAGHASELVTTARALRTLPATESALNAGDISFDKACIISRAATAIADPAKAAVAEHALLDNAPGLDTSQLRRLGEEISYRADPDAADERERRRWEKRHLSFGLTLDNTGTLHGACGDTVSYEIIATAAEAFAPPAGQLDKRSAPQRRMDGLAAACKAALDAGTAPARHGTAPHISILVRDETLARTPGAPPAQTGHGNPLTASQVLALCCGAHITAIRWKDGLPLDVGRSARTEPPNLRRALEARDRTCRWPGCDSPATWATAHHITGWTNGGRTSLAGMVLLCHTHHHYFIHRLGWTITGNPNGTLRFTHPSRMINLDSPLPATTNPGASPDPWSNARWDRPATGFPA